MKKLCVLPIILFSVSIVAKDSVNIAKAPLKDAKKEAVVFAGETILKKLLPDLDKNYQFLQERCKLAINIPRIDMPVIMPKQIEDFRKSLEQGELDINEPYAKDKFFKKQFPTDLNLRNPRIRERWLKLGLKDGDLDDDKIKVTEEWVKARDLKPTQSQIWLSKLIKDIVKWGPPREKKARLRKRIIIAQKDKDGLSFIVDGHHWYGRIVITDPELEIPVLRIDLPIDKLLKIGRSYGNARGNKQQQ